MISIFKSIFSKSNKEEATEDVFDSVTAIRAKMERSMKDTQTPTLSYPEGFDPKRPTLIILDDNQGATMLFEDDIRYVQRERKDIASGVQFLSITTSQAAFILKAEIDSKHIQNVIGAVLDITLGGYAIVDGHTITLDGIDMYEMLHKRFSKAALRFFTSHTMNKKNAEIFKFMQKFFALTNKDIQEYTYMKNPFTDSRRDVLIDILTEYKNESN